MEQDPPLRPSVFQTDALLTELSIHSRNRTGFFPPIVRPDAAHSVEAGQAVQTLGKALGSNEQLPLSLGGSMWCHESNVPYANLPSHIFQPPPQ
jgi:hypothetical protein